MRKSRCWEVGGGWDGGGEEGVGEEEWDEGEEEWDGERRGGKVGMGEDEAFAAARADSCASIRWKSLSACIWISSSAAVDRDGVER